MYTPHTVTLIIARDGEYNSVVLNGVFLDLNKRSNINKSGLADADAATLYIPFSISANKKYVSPKEYAGSADKSRIWTLFDGGDESGAECYFVKGIVDAMPYREAKEQYDYCYHVSSVDMRDYGSARMQHWQVGGR